jgi:hypothetical protein
MFAHGSHDLIEAGHPRHQAQERARLPDPSPEFRDLRAGLRLANAVPEWIAKAEIEKVTCGLEIGLRDLLKPAAQDPVVSALPLGVRSGRRVVPREHRLLEFTPSSERDGCRLAVVVSHGHHQDPDPADLVAVEFFWQKWPKPELRTSCGVRNSTASNVAQVPDIPFVGPAFTTAELRVLMIGGYQPRLSAAFATSSVVVCV